MNDLFDKAVVAAVVVFDVQPCIYVLDIFLHRVQYRRPKGHHSVFSESSAGVVIVGCWPGPSSNFNRQQNGTQNFSAIAVSQCQIL